MDYINIIILALFVNNVVLAQFLGICPFLGVSSKVETSLGMGAAVFFVMALANFVTYMNSAPRCGICVLLSPDRRQDPGGRPCSGDIPESMALH